MNKIKDHPLAKIICILLLAVFVTLDIAWAHPPELLSNNYAMAIPLASQQTPVTPQTKTVQESILSEAHLLGTILSIAGYLLDDKLPIGLLNSILTTELGKAADGVKLSKVEVKNGVILVPYEKDSKRCVIQVAPKDSSSSRNITGHNQIVLGKYTVAELPEDYKAHKSPASAVMPNKNAIRRMEREISAVESRGLSGDFDAVSYASGMSSICAAFFYALEESNLPPNEAEIILYRPAYGCTDNLSDELKSLTKVKMVMNIEQLQDALSRNTAFVFFESPANPSLAIADIEKIVTMVKSSNPQAIVGFDNTFATSLGQQPLKFGADIIMVGLTKGMSGSGDILGAALIAKKEITKKLREKRNVFAEPIDALDAFKVVKYGLPYLAQRLKKQQENAFKYVDFLKAQTDIVESVVYPGDPDNKQYEIARRQMDKYGYMIYFDLGSSEKAKAFMDLIKYTRLFDIAVSLGQVRNLIEWPAGGTHANVSEADRQFGGIREGAIRWAVGVEDSEDVLRELECIFEIMRLYKDDLKSLHFSQLNEIFMAKWYGPYGEEEHLLRKFPIIIQRGKDTYLVEPDITRAIDALNDKWLQKAAGLIHKATQINKYNAQNLVITHTWLSGLLSGDHRSVVTSPGGSTTFRFESAASMQRAFASLGLLENDQGKLQPGQTQIYTRLGTPGIATLETLVTLLEAGVLDALSFKFFGFSTPSTKSAIRQVFLHWMLKTPGKENGKPVKIVVLTSASSELDRIARSYKNSRHGRLTNSTGNKRFEFEIVHTQDDFEQQLTGDIDFVFVDGNDSSLLPNEQLPLMKSRTQAKIAWLSPEVGSRAIKEGADLSITTLKDRGEELGAVLITPYNLATTFTVTRKDTSNTIRDNRAHQALLYLLPYLQVNSDAKTGNPADKKSLNRIEADNIAASLIVLARKAKREKAKPEDQKVILGIATDWIPAYNDNTSFQYKAMNGLMAKIRALPDTLRSMGLDNIELVEAEDSRALAAELLSRPDVKLSNIIAIGSSQEIERLENNAFEQLKGKALLAGIDPTNLLESYKRYGELSDKQLDVDIMKILVITLEVATGKEPPQLSWVKYDKNARVLFISLPSMKPMRFEDVRDRRNAEVESLSAA